MILTCNRPPRNTVRENKDHAICLGFVTNTNRRGYDAGYIRRDSDIRPQLHYLQAMSSINYHMSVPVLLFEGITVSISLPYFYDAEYQWLILRQICFLSGKNTHRTSADRSSTQTRSGVDCQHGNNCSFWRNGPLVHRHTSCAYQCP